MSQRSSRSSHSGRGHKASAAFLAAGRKNFGKGRVIGHGIAAAHRQSKVLSRSAALTSKAATRHPARARKT